LPGEVEQVRLFHGPGRRVWVHARLLEKSARRSLAEVDVYDEEGRLAARVRGLRSHRVAGGRDESLDELFYAYQWCRQPRPQASCEPGSGRWLLFADQGGLGSRLAEQLRARGDDCTLAWAGSSSPVSSPEDVLRLVQDFVSRDPAPCRGVIHLGNLDATAPEGLGTPAPAAAPTSRLLS